MSAEIRDTRLTAVRAVAVKRTSSRKRCSSKRRALRSMNARSNTYPQGLACIGAARDELNPGDDLRRRVPVEARCLRAASGSRHAPRYDRMPVRRGGSAPSSPIATGSWRCPRCSGPTSSFTGHCSRTSAGIAHQCLTEYFRTAVGLPEAVPAAVMVIHTFR